MYEADKLRIKREREELGVPDNAPIEFQFNKVKVTGRTFVVSGFSGLDMTKLVRYRDTFMFDSNFLNEELRVYLQATSFEVKNIGADWVELEFPQGREGYEYVRKSVQALAKVILEAYNRKVDGQDCSRFVLDDKGVLQAQ